MAFGKIREICSNAIIAFLFFLPLSTSISNILAILIILFWFIDGNFQKKFTEIKENKIALAILAYVALNIIGLLWTNDINWGLYTVKKQWKLLLMPVIMNMAIREHYRRYIYAFVAAMIVATATSYLVFMEVITLHNTNSFDPSPFTSHVTYTPLLAWAVYLMLHDLWFNRPTIKIRVIGIPLVILMVIDIFLTQGRTGQLVFFVLIIVLTIQRLSKKPLQMVAISIMASCILPSLFYTFAPPFKSIVNQTFDNLTSYDERSVNSLSERLTFARISLEIIKKHPLIGVGSGDFPTVYKETVKQKFPFTEFKYSENPHNQYFLVLCQFGLLGFIFFASIFFFQIRHSIKTKASLRHLRLAFPIFFLVIFVGDAYLQTSTTALLFSTLSGILFKQNMT